MHESLDSQIFLTSRRADFSFVPRGTFLKKSRASASDCEEPRKRWDFLSEISRTSSASTSFSSLQLFCGAWSLQVLSSLSAGRRAMWFKDSNGLGFFSAELRALRTCASSLWRTSSTFWPNAGPMSRHQPMFTGHWEGKIVKCLEDQWLVVPFSSARLFSASSATCSSLCSCPSRLSTSGRVPSRAIQFWIQIGALFLALERLFSVFFVSSLHSPILPPLQLQFL